MSLGIFFGLCRESHLAPCRALRAERRRPTAPPEHRPNAPTTYGDVRRARGTHRGVVGGPTGPVLTASEPDGP